MALFVTHSPAIGGAEIVLERFLRERPGRHSVLVLSDGACGEFFEQSAARVTTLPIVADAGGVTRKFAPREGARAAAMIGRRLRELSRALEASGEDVIVTNSMKAHVLVPPVARRLRRVIGIRLHDILIPSNASRAARLVLGAAGHLAHSTAANSRATANEARALRLPRVESFPNGVDLGEPKEARPQRALSLLSVSHLAPGKGVDEAIAAIATARSAGVDAELDVLGDAAWGHADYRRSLHERVEALGLRNVIRFHGHVDDTRPFYRNADALLHLPRLPDTLPTVILEAHAWSLPVVATSVGGIGEIVVDEETGFLVNGDGLAGAAAAIARLVDPAARMRMQEAARRRIEEHFSVERYVAAFDAWLDRLAARCGAGR